MGNKNEIVFNANGNRLKEITSNNQYKELSDKIGDLSQLQTTDKTSLTKAINEHASELATALENDTNLTATMTNELVKKSDKTVTQLYKLTTDSGQSKTLLNDKTDVWGGDANNILTDYGSWYMQSQTLNKPITGTGILLVQGVNGTTSQLFIPNASGTTMYYRGYTDAGGWTVWIPVMSQKMVDDTLTKFGLGDLSKNISNTDLNVLATTGLFAGNNLANNPTGNTSHFFHLTSHVYSTTYKTQIAQHFGSGSNGAGRMWRRQMSAGTWTAWEEIASETLVLTNITLQNGATVASSRTPKYTKIGKQIVVQGEIASVANGTVIGTLPVGFRPAYPLLFSTALNNTTTLQVATIEVNSTGAIKVVIQTAVGSAIALNGITFIAEL